MFDPTIDTIIFLSGAFILGLVLGWALWKLGTTKDSGGETSETEYWQQRFNQSRREQDVDKTKIEALTKERNDLRKRLKAA